MEMSSLFYFVSETFWLHIPLWQCACSAGEAGLAVGDGSEQGTS